METPVEISAKMQQSNKERRHLSTEGSWAWKRISISYSVEGARRMEALMKILLAYWETTARDHTEEQGVVGLKSKGQVKTWFLACRSAK